MLNVYLNNKNKALSSLPVLVGRFAILIFFVVLGLAPSHSIASSPVSIVVNSSVDINELSLKDVRAIFTMKKRLWVDGKQVRVFVLPDDDSLHKQFCIKVLGVFPRQLESVWYRLVYSGTGHAPIEVGSEQELLERVANTEGAIGYIQSVSENDKTKIITIK
mgnify:FL=1